jgi:hypothetical protein
VDAASECTFISEESLPLVHEKNFLAFFLVEHHVIGEKGRIGKDQVVNFLRTDVPSSQYRDRWGESSEEERRLRIIRHC